MLRSLLLLALAALPAFAADNALRDQVTGLFKQRQWAEAQAVLEKVTAAEPANAEAWNYLGQTFLARNDYEKAVPLLEKATQLDPTSSETMLQLGHAYGVGAMKSGLFSKLGFAKKCKAAYDKAVELDPKNIDARWSVMEYCKQAPGFIGGGMDGAYVQAEAIKKLDPPRGRQALAGLYLADKKYDAMLAEFDEVLKVSPDDYTSLYQVGRFSANSGQFFERGLVALRRCLQLPPPEGEPGHAPAQWRMGSILERQGDKAGAKAAYEAALAVDPTFTRAIEALRKLNGG